MISKSPVKWFKVAAQARRLLAIAAVLTAARENKRRRSAAWTVGRCGTQSPETADVPHGVPGASGDDLLTRPSGPCWVIRFNVSLAQAACIAMMC